MLCGRSSLGISTLVTLKVEGLVNRLPSPHLFTEQLLCIYTRGAINLPITARPVAEITEIRKAKEDEGGTVSSLEACATSSRVDVGLGELT